MGLSTGSSAEAWRCSADGGDPGRGQVSSLHCSPRVLPACPPAHLLAAVVQCQMQMSRGSCPGFLQVAPPTSLSRGLSVQLDAVLLELRTQQGVVILQLLDLNNKREVILAKPSCQIYSCLHPSHHRGSLAGFFCQKINNQCATVCVCV